MKNKDWFQIKGYVHIGFPLKKRDRKWVYKYVTSEKDIAKHAFLPLIQREIPKRKLTKSKIEYYECGPLQGRPKVMGKPKSPRLINFASHLDANIYRYFAHKLEKKYDVLLKAKGLENSVIAYRHIPINTDSSGERGKSNINFAKDAFEFIQQFPNDNIGVLTSDISDFFNSLDHKILKKRWCELLAVDRLSPEDYNIFNNVTNYSFIKERKIFQLFSEQIYVKRAYGIRKKKLKRLSVMRREKAIAFCERKDIKKIQKKGLIEVPKKVKENKSIPQGLPISSVLANLYMISFDIEINKHICNLGGLYLRYSDDILVVVAKDKLEELKWRIQDEIKKLNLEIHPDKTQEFRFIRTAGKLTCEQLKDGSWKADSLGYLGLQFDGATIHLKNASISSYYAKLRKTIRRSTHFAIMTDNDYRFKLFTPRILYRFTHLGSKRGRRKYRKKGSKNQYVLSEDKNWGNYYSYVRNAARITGSKGISKQMRKHLKNVNNQIYQAESKMSEKIRVMTIRGQRS